LLSAVLARTNENDVFLKLFIKINIKIKKDLTFRRTRV
ncbi:hypothetical protein LCGC14_1411920, partial [marine sediment metagenome]